MTSSKKIMLSAVQPTSRLTIGNYIGAVMNWSKMQSDYDCVFFAVDLHAITDARGSPELRKNTYQAIATYLACGLDPARVILYCQSHVPAHAELSWILTCHAAMGEVSRMTQFKDKSQKHGETIPMGLFAYPVMMAADILIHQANLVPVGADQKQHVELTRDLATRMNNFYTPGWNASAASSGKGVDAEPLFTLPEAWIPKQGGKIMSLQDPTKKMSKSDVDPSATLFLDDTDKEIEKKVKRAVTDSGSEITDSSDKPGVRNLLEIQSVLTGKSIPDLVASYAGKQYGHLKVDTAQVCIEAIRPIREEVTRRMSDTSHLDQVLKQGAEKARERAAKTLSRVYDKMGFIPRT